MEPNRDLTQPMITLNRVSKTYYSENVATPVIDEISLSVAENEFVVLFGPGQCGKSTLIHMMAGLEPPTQGEIEVNGQPVTGPSPDRGVVYQTTALFPFLTVQGNVEYGPRACGLPKAERQARAQKYIDLVGLTGFEKSYPNALSGGMRQRVGIARAYSNEPAVLLMDEPFGHLDAQTRYMMEEEIEKIWQQAKRTVVFVTNSIEEALYLGDRIILLTKAPARIKQEYRVNLPRPRNLTSPEFLALREEIERNIDRSTF